MSSPFFTYRGRVDEVIDGDTYDLVLDCGFGSYYHTRVRLAGVDTHETYGVSHDSEEYEKGRAEARFVKEWLSSAADGHDGEWPLVVGTIRDSTGKYGRYLAEVYRRDTGEQLKDVLLDEFDGISY
jgi:micrococcal nuclease